MPSGKVADEVQGGVVVDGGGGDVRGFVVCGWRFRRGWVIVDGTIWTVVMVQMTAR